MNTETLEERIEERIKKLEEMIVNGSLASENEPSVDGKNGSVSGDSVLTEPQQEARDESVFNMRFKLPTFDGKSPWSTYLRQFEAISLANQWTEAQKAFALTAALRGDAADVLRTVAKGQEKCYQTIFSRLDNRYGDAHMQAVYRAQLRNRMQQASENLQEFEVDIARLVRSAYPKAPDDILEDLAVEAFVTGLRDSDLQKALKLARPKLLDEALAIALEHEAAGQSSRGHRVRSIEEEVVPSGENLEEMVRKIVRESTPKGRGPRCWNCGEMGHIRRNCKKPLEQSEKLCTVRRTTVINDQWQPQQLQKAQEDDPCLKLVLDWMRQDRRPSWQEISACSPEVKCFWSQWNCLVLKDDLLYRTFESEDGTESRLQLIVPGSKVSEILRQLHDGASGGHFGITKTLQKVRERFYWVHCKDDVRRWCRNCELCATANGPAAKKRAPMRQYNVGSPMERVAIDIAGPFPETDRGNKYILVAMDYFTKWTEAYAIRNQEASTVAEVLVKEFFSRFGVPLEIHSDQGRNFESALFQDVCRLLGTNKTRTTPLHPQSDGMVERMNRTMGKHLSKVVSEHQRDWDQYLHLFLMAYRSAVNETTSQTPACLMFGREVRLPCDLEFGRKPSEEHVAGEGYADQLKARMNDVHDLARRNIQIASDRMRDQYNIRSTEGSFDAGDLVWLYNPQRRRGLSPKLQRHWEGPYEVKKKINDVVYRIRKLPRGKPRVVHMNRLARYDGSNNTEEARIVQEDSSEDCHHPNFNEFMSNYAERKKARFGVTSEVQQDLFKVADDVSMAHCVSQDLRMDKGISVVFRKRFGQLDELQRQQPRVGKVLRLEDTRRSLFYLVTKRSSADKPTYKDVWRTLVSLKNVVCLYDIKKLALPKITDGLGSLDWKIVRSMIEVIFRGTDVRVTVCCFNHREVYAQKTVDCYFFLKGACRAGVNCRFRHVVETLENVATEVSDRDDQNLRRGQCNELPALPVNSMNQRESVVFDDVMFSNKRETSGTPGIFT